jgi:uncharacterized SAM-binding protein YcdF (DUF218 family)
VSDLLDGVRWALALAFGVDAVRSFFTPDASLLGIFVRWPGGAALPSVLGLLLAGALLVRHRVSLLVLAAFAVLSVVNTAEFYALRARGLPAAALPFSLVTLALLAGAAARHLQDGPPGRWTWKAAGGALASPFLVVLHLFSFGATDYARPAEAIVVFGAGVTPDGRPSLALWQRVVHGVRLHRAGIAPLLVMSGAADEVPVMRRLALEAGVPEAAIVDDPAGVNTYATVANLRQKRVVAVSHYYHLARIKLTASRLGIRCVTAPCPMNRRLAREPYYVAREVAAFAAYYLFRS